MTKDFSDEKPDKLVLKVEDADPKIFDWSAYNGFLDALCKKREYQKECIIKICNFFLGKKYENIKELAIKNYKDNEAIKELHDNEEQYLKEFDLQDKLSCTFDLATGTGKSWVIYGVAQILLCENAIDNVLILCPSLTIEKELYGKLKKFTYNKNLKSSLPTSKPHNPKIIFANDTIEKNCICIENVHAIYAHVSSSIEDSIKGKGNRTLVINDEAHHILNPKAEVGPEGKYMTQWLKFLKDPKYGFSYILNSTGTPYKNKKYFRDVIYRYSIRKAITEEFIKDIKYLVDVENLTEEEKFRLVYKNHKENKKKYPEIKTPITIFVTNTIENANNLFKKLKKYLQKEEKLDNKTVDEKMIIVTSDKNHKKNIERLEKVDSQTSKVEWIVSVSMLTEGWDVKNVFQIVPNEERAFNSQLLISQVLGRGLRIPVDENEKILTKNYPVVTVTNHSSWSKRIENYVESVIEHIRISSHVPDKKNRYNFDIHYLESKREDKEVKLTPTKGKIKLPEPPLAYHPQKTIKEATYRKIKRGEESYISIKSDLKPKKIEEVVTHVHNKIHQYDEENKTNFAKKVNKDYIRNLIKKSLKSIGETRDIVSDINGQITLQSFNTLYRKGTGSAVPALVYIKPQMKNTRELNQSNISVMSFDPTTAIVYNEKAIKKSEKKDIEIINNFKENTERRVGNVIEVNDEHYKCPQNTVILVSGPEIEFAKRLTNKDYSKIIDSWIKSTDYGFYGFDYIYKPTTHSITKQFNPDFFIKKNKDVLVVEIKMDLAKEESDEEFKKNVAKNEYAERYFGELNKQLKGKQKFLFYFLSPRDYGEFFDKLKKDQYKNYIPSLQRKLKEARKNGKKRG
ncbi:DEAD/DEAH box helicase [Nanoarchaeota archaeon]